MGKHTDEAARYLAREVEDGYANDLTGLSDEAHRVGYLATQSSQNGVSAEERHDLHTAATMLHDAASNAHELEGNSREAKEHERAANGHHNATKNIAVAAPTSAAASAAKVYAEGPEGESHKLMDRSVKGLAITEGNLAATHKKLQGLHEDMAKKLESTHPKLAAAHREVAGVHLAMRGPSDAEKIAKAPASIAQVNRIIEKHHEAGAESGKAAKLKAFVERQIEVGEHGGRFYMTESGKKVYVRK